MPSLRYPLLAWLAGWLLGGWPGPAAQAQRPATPWQPDPLLSSLLVQRLVFGPDGYGWLATDEGVHRYDGYTTVPLAQLTRPGSPAAPRGYTQLAFDRAGQLWIGSSTGLYCLVPATGQLMRLPLPLAPAEPPAVSTLWHDARTGRLWLGYGYGRLLCFDLRRPRLPTRPPASLTGGVAIGSILPASGGEVWATATGTLVLDGQGHLRRRYPSPGFFVVPVPGTRPQQVVSWQALFTVDSATGRLREQQRWLSGPNAFDLRFFPAPDAAGRPATWLAQGRRIELRWAAGAARPTVRVVPLAAGPAGAGRPSAARVYAVVHDPAGLGWAYSPGFRGGYREGPLPVVHPLALARPLANPSVRGLARLPDGRLLVSTYGGTLTQAADSAAAPLRAWPLHYPAPDPRLPMCYDLLVSRAGRVLFANEDNCFGKINPRTGEVRDFAPAPGSPASAATQGHTLFQDRAGTVWGGAQNGLYQLNEATGRSTRYRPHEAAYPLHQCDVRSLAEDAVGTLWLATSHGLYALSPATHALRHYGPDEPDPARRLPTADLLSVLIPGPDNLVWLATREAGLLAFDPSRGVVRRLTAAQGLPAVPVATLLPGPGGTVWAGTYAGLVRYAPAPDQLTVYGPADGLAEPELNQQAAFRDHDGTLYFGGIGGVYRVENAAPAAAAVVPRLLFTARTRADSVVQWLPAGAAPAAGLRLPSVAAEAGLDLALTDYRSPAQARFYYRLRPADGPAPGPVQHTDHHLRLHGLAAGTYTLEVWGQTADGQRSAARRVPVLVARPWWQHPAALASGAVLLVLLGAAAQWLRGRRALREARLRTRIAADLHDEVGALLTRVSMRAELLHAQPTATAGPALVALLTDSRAAQDSMRDLVWGIDASADTIGALLDRLRDHLDRTAEPTGLRTSLTAHHLPDAQFLAPALRQHLYLLAKEAITNAVRHATHATELRVELGRLGPSFYLRVADDGAPASRPGGSGLGLRSMQQRAQAMGGHLTAGPRPAGVGWEVYLVVDYRRLVGGE